jgi:DNA-binding winged helix-turn-helix (wHTH) protein/pimeloyl-ACP methyl ester carboxylesterase
MQKRPAARFPAGLHFPYCALDFCWERRSHGGIGKTSTEGDGGASLLYRFEDFELDTDRRELRRRRVQISLAPQVFDLLSYLIRNREHVVGKDDLLSAVWGGRIVSESALTTRINAARSALGDDGETQRLIRTLPRRGFRFVGEVREEPDSSVTGGQSLDLAKGGTPAAAAPGQEISYCRAADGVRLAYAEVGHGPRLFKAANYLNHLEYDWECPVTRHLLHSLARNFTLVRYDARGNGLSDWEVADVSFEAWVSDLETVADTVGWKRFPLMGMSQGCAISIAYAVRHPERVSHLILYGSFARGRLVCAASDEQREKISAMETLVRLGWGEENAAFRQMFTSLFVPGGSKEQIDWFNELQRRTTSPECAARYFRTTNEIDVRALLPKVKVPTLVLHLRDDAVHAFEYGREVAAGIPGARFVPLNGKNHMPLQQDPAAPRILEEIKLFLAS